MHKQFCSAHGHCVRSSVCMPHIVRVHVVTVLILLEHKTRVLLKARSKGDLCCLMQLLKDWQGRTFLAVVKLTSESWFVLASAVASKVLRCMSQPLTEAAKCTHWHRHRNSGGSRPHNFQLVGVLSPQKSRLTSYYYDHFLFSWHFVCACM